VVLMGLDNAGKTTLQYKLKTGEFQEFVPTQRANEETFVRLRWQAAMRRARASDRDGLVWSCAVHRRPDAQGLGSRRCALRRCGRACAHITEVAKQGTRPRGTCGRDTPPWYGVADRQDLDASSRRPTPSCS
jgi:GTPase SAR1 family protein